MEANRQDLHELLKQAMIDCGEEPHLYYQPPESVKLVYPCFIYKFRTFTSQYADDIPYRTTIGFEVTYITRSPKSKVPSEMVKKMEFAFDRYFVSDNLHHYVYTTTTSLKESIND